LIAEKEIIFLRKIINQYKDYIDFYFSFRKHFQFYFYYINTYIIVLNILINIFNTSYKVLKNIEIYRKKKYIEDIRKGRNKKDIEMKSINL